MQKLLIAYFGTPSLSARFLENLLTDISIKHLIEIKLVITQPDKPVGRKQILAQSAVKTIARKYAIHIYNKQIVGAILKSPEKRANQDSPLQKLFTHYQIDLALLYAYGKIIPKELLKLPRYGFWNIHPSLLPKYRGASPIAYPLIFGDKTTGVTLMRMDEKIDHGPILAQEEIEILPHDKRPDLEIKLTDLGFRLFKSVILNLVQDLKKMPKARQTSKHVRHDKLLTKPQQHNKATYAPYLSKNDGYIQLHTLKKALLGKPLLYEELPKIVKGYIEKTKQDKVHLGNVVYNMFCGLYPWPGIWTTVRIRGQTRRLKIIDMDCVVNRHACLLQIKKVQLEGKKEVDFKTFEKAYKIFNAG